jgi:hypothetical protein
MLGRLGMSVTEAIACYGTLAKTVFSSVKRTGGEGRFRATKLEQVIKEVIRERTGHPDERMMDTRSEGKGCKTYEYHERYLYIL